MLYNPKQSQESRKLVIKFLHFLNIRCFAIALICLVLTGYESMAQTERVWSRTDLEPIDGLSIGISEMHDYGDNEIILFANSLNSYTPRDRARFPEFYIIDSKGNQKRSFRFQNVPPGQILGAKVLADKSFVVCLRGTSSTNRTYLFKSDTKGNIIWLKSFGSDIGSQEYFGTNHVQFLPDGGCYFTLEYDERSKGVNEIPDTIYGMNDVAIYRVDGNGNLLWNRNIGTSGWDQGIVRGTGIDAEGNFQILGKAFPQEFSEQHDHDLQGAIPDGFFDIVIDSTGEILERRFYPALDTIANLQFLIRSEFNFPLFNINDSVFYSWGSLKFFDFKPVGYNSPDTGSGDAGLLRFSKDNLSYEIIPYGGSGYDGLEDVTVLPNGNTVIVGRTKSSEWDNDNQVENTDPWIMLLNPEMEVIYSESFYYDPKNDVAGEAFSEVSVVGKNQVIIDANGYGLGHFTALNFFDFDRLTTSVFEMKQNHSGLSVFPNPIEQGNAFTIAGAKETIKVFLFDSQGKKVKGTFITTNGHIGTSNIAKGLYSIIVISAERHEILYQGQIVVN